MSYYERNLPHWHPEGAAIFLTWCLHGVYQARDRNHTGKNACATGRAFVALDRELDTVTAGPKWLTDPVIAQCVVDALRFGERQLSLYRLVAFCVMPNHVHTVVDPKVPVPKSTKAIKGFTARTANEILCRTGERFWQAETHDHWIRNSDEQNRIVQYVECNPVVAGFVETPQSWPWSSAFEGEER